jgi:adenylate kinase family enzyme
MLRPIIFSVGLPGVGKGQMGYILRKNYVIDWLPVSRLILRYKKDCSGRDTYKDDESLATNILLSHINNSAIPCYIDGFPRTKKQLESIRLLFPSYTMLILLIINAKDSDSFDRCVLRKQCKSCRKIKYSKHVNCPTCGDILYRRKSDTPFNIRNKISINKKFIISLQKRLHIFHHVYEIPYMEVIDGGINEIINSINLEKRKSPIEDDYNLFETQWSLCST